MEILYLVNALMKKCHDIVIFLFSTMACTFFVAGSFLTSLVYYKRSPNVAFD